MSQDFGYPPPFSTVGIMVAESKSETISKISVCGTHEAAGPRHASLSGGPCFKVLGPHVVDPTTKSPGRLGARRSDVDRGSYEQMNSWPWILHPSTSGAYYTVPTTLMNSTDE